MARLVAWSAWYHSPFWRKRRAVQLREHPLCAMCLSHGIVKAATIADHVVPHRGDIQAFMTGKLQSLCFACHNSPKKFEESRGYRPDIGADGWPTDPRHPTMKQR